jgi:hypothetical protein
MRTDGLEPRDAQVLAEPAPCDGCRFAAKCRAEKLTCAAFTLYVSGAGRPRWRVAPRAPTGVLYSALLEVESRPFGRFKKVRAERIKRRRRAVRGAPILAI